MSFINGGDHTDVKDTDYQSLKIAADYQSLKIAVLFCLAVKFVSES